METGEKDFFTNAFLGIVGGFLGGRIGSILHIGSGWLAGMVLSIIGSCIVIAVFRKVKQK